MTPNDLIPTPRWLLGQLLQVITAPTTSLTLNLSLIHISEPTRPY